MIIRMTCNDNSFMHLLDAFIRDFHKNIRNTKMKKCNNVDERRVQIYKNEVLSNLLNPGVSNTYYDIETKNVIEKGIYESFLYFVSIRKPSVLDLASTLFEVDIVDSISDNDSLGDRYNGNLVWYWFHTADTYICI